MGIKNRRKRRRFLLLALCLTLFLSGCRTRTNGGGQDETVFPDDSGTAAEAQGDLSSDSAAFESPQGGEETDLPEDGEASERTTENPEASRKEYDENAPAEVVAGTDRLLHGEGEGSGSPALGEDEGETVSRLNDEADETATQTIAAQEAEELGVSEDGETADSAMTYFTVLLAERAGSLFECQRANLYWETAEDHVTIHKSSPEHALILNAGAYDVSAKLLPENLRVDDGWVTRKNPQVIVKVVGRGILGSGTASTGAARGVYQQLTAREGWSGIDAVKSGQVLLISEELMEAPYLQTAAMLMIAKTANASVYADVDLDEALQMLMEEAAGTLPTGIYYYSGKEE